MNSVMEKIYFGGFLSFFIGLHILDSVSMFYFPVTLYPHTLGVLVWVNWTVWGSSIILGIVMLASFSGKMGSPSDMLDIWRRFQILVTGVSMLGAIWFYNGTSLVYVFLLMPVIRWTCIIMTYVFFLVADFEGDKDGSSEDIRFEPEETA